MAAAAILNFAKRGILGHGNPYMANIYQCTKFDENIFIYDWDMAKNQKFKMATAAILNLKTVILGSSDHCMANICLQTKFGANRYSNSW